MPKSTKPKAGKSVEEKKEKKSDAFSVTMSIADKVYTASADTLIEAFDQLKPVSYKTKAFLTVEKGGKKSQMMFFVLQLRRFIGSSIFRQVWAKRMESMLK